MKNFVSRLKNSHNKSKSRMIRTMQLRGSHEKETMVIGNSNKIENLQIRSLSIRNIHERLLVLESILMIDIKEFEKIQMCQEIADDLRF